MFTAQEIRRWCNKYWAVSMQHVEKKVPREVARDFYDRWLSLMLYLIDSGYDKDGVFAETAIKILNLQRTKPDIVSFHHPFTQGGRDVGKVAETLMFFVELSKVCTIIERERRNS